MLTEGCAWTLMQMKERKTEGPGLFLWLMVLLLRKDSTRVGREGVATNSAFGRVLATVY